MAINFLEVLEMRGFDTNRRLRFLRHQASDYDIIEIQRQGWLEAYQSFQQRPVLDKVDCFASFVGVGSTQARFVGIYEILGRRTGQEGILPAGCPYKEWRECKYFYELHKEPGYEDLENRVEIEWGLGGRAWHQWASAKEVAQILPKAQPLTPFTDYLGFTLTHAELKRLNSQPDANREWRARLRSVAGVYLVLATTTGAQYVGSAHGTDGFWGRWEAYARNGHGENVLLKGLVESKSAYPEAFLYSILHIVPPTLARSEVLKLEILHKQKLGSRAVGLDISAGLNAN